LRNQPTFQIERHEPLKVLKAFQKFRLLKL
jgi:hypothetical protein